MFSKIERTNFPPQNKPVMIWDGECGFCQYWIERWKSKTGERIDYLPFQEKASHFKDIPLKEFKKASRFIETDGSIYSGPDSAYKSFTYFENPNLFFHSLYKNNGWFTYLSDHTYNFIAKRRPLFFRVSKLAFGRNPTKMKPYWFLILLFIFSIFYLLFKFL